MKLKVDRILDAQLASKDEAERILRTKINNLLYGDSGYIINERWIPAEIIDKQTVPFNTLAEKASYLIKELESFGKEMENSKPSVQFRGKKALKNKLNEITNLLS